MTMSAETLCVDWEDIISVLRMAAPKMGKYGGDVGGDTAKMLRMLRDDDLINRVAQGIWKLQIARSVADSKRTALQEAVRASGVAYRNGIAELAKSIKNY
jgi:hypothetical protein